MIINYSSDTTICGKEIGLPDGLLDLTNRCFAVIGLQTHDWPSTSGNTIHRGSGKIVYNHLNYLPEELHCFLGSFCLIHPSRTAYYIKPAAKILS